MTAASSASDARNPDGAGVGMGRNVSGDPGDNFRDTQKTPKWLSDLITHTEAYAADIAHGTTRCCLCRQTEEKRWVDYDDGHAGGYPHPCSTLERAGRDGTRYRCIDRTACRARVRDIVRAHQQLGEVCK